MIRSLWLFSLLLAPVLAGGLSEAAAQEPEASAQESSTLLPVYLDCAARGCDSQRFRRDIPYVDWVREPAAADVHVIITSQNAGGGGTQYTLDFIGTGELEEFTDRYLFSAGSTDVDEERAAGLSSSLALGLVRFIRLTGTGEGLSVAFSQPSSGAEIERSPTADPWNAWVFSIRGGGNVDREDRSRSSRYNTNASANRTTEQWKVDLNVFANWNRSEFELSDSTTYVNETNSWSVSSLLVRSLSDHWSLGVRGGAGTSTRQNQDFRANIAPAVEWNYFPWQDASRRRLVALYSVGIEYFEYEETTVYDRDVETIARHRLDLSYRSQETWGEAQFGAEAAQILGDLKRYSLDFGGSIDYRIARGLNLNFGGSFELIRDQIYLSGEGLSDEEILVQRRQRATGSRLSFDLGLSVRFGSIFNNVVNSRFSSGGGR